jgi:lysozyme family protein
MGSSFDLAIPTILRREGGYVWDASDAGGETNFGISKRSYPNLDIKNLTSADASAIYKRDWWDIFGYGRILEQRIATKILDMAVNLGSRMAHKVAQEAAGCTVDGVLGPESIKALNDAQAAPLLCRIQDLQAVRYRNIVSDHPEDAKFLAGWLARAYDRV